MRVALMHPTYWPEIRRGSERLIHDLAQAMTGSGHDVTILTSHDGSRRMDSEDGFTVIRSRRPPGWIAGRRSYEEHLALAPAVVHELLRGEFDLAHAFFNVHAWAALKARPLGGPPVAFSVNGIPVREYLVGRRYRLPITLEAVKRAGACSVLSRSAAERFRRYLLREPQIVPGAVFCADFDVDEPRADVPTILFASDFHEPRKRAPLLLQAFARLRALHPEARLLLAGRPSGGPPALPDRVEWLDVAAPDALARAYASAWVTVQPSVEEAFGLVLVESLAAGTPVVAARSGGPPEIVSDDAVGRLFEPDDEEDLSRAIGTALELVQDDTTRAACKTHASRWDWERVLPLYESLQSEAAAAGPSRG